MGEVELKQNQNDQRKPSWLTIGKSQLRALSTNTECPWGSETRVWLMLEKHLHKRLTNCPVTLWFCVVIVLHWSYGERSTLIRTVFGLVLSWQVTCHHDVLKRESELNLIVDTAISGRRCSILTSLSLNS